MARKPTLKQAKAWAIRVYTLALKKAEKGDWEGAHRLTHQDESSCKFCLHYGGDECPESPSPCVVAHLCGDSDYRTRAAERNALCVIGKRRTPSNGLRHFRRTIEQLKALEV